MPNRIHFAGGPLPPSYQPANALRCWNGKSTLHPDCAKPYGSQNLPVYERETKRDWRWFADLARLWRAEGLFGRELGSDSDFYYFGVLVAMERAHDALRQAGRTQDAEDVRLGIRAAVAWDAMTAIATPLRRELANEMGRLRVLVPGQRYPRRWATVAVAGNRHSTIEHSPKDVLSSDDSHSRALANALKAPGLLLPEEKALVLLSVNGDADAARQIAGWMFGTIDLAGKGPTPEVRWRWRLRRTTEGAESVYFGPWVNPHKPARSVAQITHDGILRTMRPTPENVTNNMPGGGKFDASGYEVAIDGGQITARSKYGEATIPELGGAVLLQVDVCGSEITWTAGT